MQGMASVYITQIQAKQISPKCIWRWAMTKKAVPLLVGIAALAFSAAAYGLRQGADAQPPHPKLRETLPAANLPVVPVAAETRSQMETVLARAATRYGITPASYRELRRIATTPVGQLLLIPGFNGACLFLAYAVSCGDPGAAGEPMLALLVKPLSRNALVGGGITSVATERVTIKTSSGRGVGFSARDGAFVVSEASGLTSNDELLFVAD
jgi:hypothetical protein